MGWRGPASSETNPPKTETQTVKWWWQTRGATVIEEMKKVAYLQGQLDQTMQSLQKALRELQEIVGIEEEAHG